jgi:hypothetical protein
LLWEKGNAVDYTLLAVVVPVLHTANGEELAKVLTEVMSRQQGLNRYWLRSPTLAGEHTSADCRTD